MKFMSLVTENPIWGLQKTWIMDKTAAYGFEMTDCTFSASKGDLRAPQKAACVFLSESSGCIMRSLGSKWSVMHRFQKALLPLLCSSRQTDSKEPTGDKTSQERNHHTLLCLFKRTLHENMSSFLDIQRQDDASRCHT